MVVIHRLLHENQPPKIHHASCWLVYPSSRAVPQYTVSSRLMFARHAIRTLARSHTTIHKGKTSIRRIVTISLSFRASKWIFFGNTSKKQRSYMHIHTHQQAGVYYALWLSEREWERAIELLFIFVHFAPAELTPVNCARE
jgi:hypothetical protein